MSNSKKSTILEVKKLRSWDLRREILNEFEMETTNGDKIIFNGVPGGMDNRGQFLWMVEETLSKNGWKINKNVVFLAKHYLSKIGGPKKWPEAARLIKWMESNLGEKIHREYHGSYGDVKRDSASNSEEVKVDKSPRKSAKPWTQEDLENLKKYWEQGMSGSEIGNLLGFRRESVLSKVRRLGLSKRK